MKIINRIKSKTFEGYSARTDICIEEVNGETTLWIVRVYLTKKKKKYSTLVAKRGNIYIYLDGIGFRMDTLRAVSGCLKEILRNYERRNFRIRSWCGLITQKLSRRTKPFSFLFCAVEK